MGTITYEQPYNLKSQNAGLLIDVRNASNVTQTSFTAPAYGIGSVTLTVTDTAETTLFFVRNSDGARLAVTTFDPRNWYQDSTGITTLLSRITALRATLWDNLTNLDALVSADGARAAVAILVNSGNKLMTDSSGRVTVAAIASGAAAQIWDHSLGLVNNPGSIGKKIKDWVLGSDNKALISADTHISGVTVANIGDKTGMSILASDKDVLASLFEARLLNDGDGQALINAIVSAIGNQNVDQLALVALIRSDLERNGGALATILGNYARRTGDYATLANVTASVGALNNLSSSQVQAAVSAVLNAYDPPTRAEATADKNELLTKLDVPVSDAVSAANAAKVSADVAKASADEAARPEDVQVTVNPTPVTVNPTPVTVNPTPVSGGFTPEDRANLALKPTLQEMNDGLDLGNNDAYPTIEDFVLAMRGGGGANPLFFNPLFSDVDGPKANIDVSVLLDGILKGFGQTDVTGHVHFQAGYGFVLEAGNQYELRYSSSAHLSAPPQTFTPTTDSAPPIVMTKRPPLPASTQPGMVPFLFRGLPFNISGAGVEITLEIMVDEGAAVGDKFLLNRKCPPGVTNTNAEALLNAWPPSIIGDLYHKVTATWPGEGDIQSWKVKIPEGGGDMSKMNPQPI